MKKYFFLGLIIACIKFSIYSQKTDTLFYKGKIIGIGQTHNGKRIGKWAFQIIDGIPYETIMYGPGDTAILSSYCSFENDRQIINISATESIGEKIEVIDTFYLCRLQEGYIDSANKFINNGSFKIFYPNEKIWEQGQMKCGRPEGEWLVYYYSGSIGNIIHYKNGYHEGSFKAFHNHGKGIMVEGMYNKSAKIGTWKTYFPNGKLKEIGSYNKDISALKITSENMDSLIKVFPNEKDLFEIYVINQFPFNFKSGKWEYFDKEGNIVRKERYKKGILIKEWTKENGWKKK